jgi:hypothetical protein
MWIPLQAQGGLDRIRADLGAGWPAHQEPEPSRKTPTAIRSSARRSSRMAVSGVSPPNAGLPPTKKARAIWSPSFAETCLHTDWAKARRWTMAGAGTRPCGLAQRRGSPLSPAQARAATRVGPSTSLSSRTTSRIFRSVVRAIHGIQSDQSRGPARWCGWWIHHHGVHRG